MRLELTEGDSREVRIPLYSDSSKSTSPPVFFHFRGRGRFERNIILEIFSSIEQSKGSEICDPLTGKRRGKCTSSREVKISDS
jgi:hypothetical protein